MNVGPGDLCIFLLPYGLCPFLEDFIEPYNTQEVLYLYQCEKPDLFKLFAISRQNFMQCTNQT